MASAGFISHCVNHDGCSSESGFLSPTSGNTETFAAFLDRFTEGSWPLPDIREKRSISSFAELDHGCHISRSNLVDTASKASTRVVTRSPHQAPTGGCDIIRARPSGSNETCTDSSPVADNDGTEADDSCAPEAFRFRGKLLHVSVRKLTNATYLRRMHLSREDAAELFPDVKSALELVYKTKMTRRESLAPFKKGTCVYIHDIEGRRWPVVLECLRTAGQRHVRFNKGWAEVCSANRISVGMCVRLARWKEESSSSCDITDAHVVTLSRV